LKTRLLIRGVKMNNLNLAGFKFIVVTELTGTDILLKPARFLNNGCKSLFKTVLLNRNLNLNRINPVTNKNLKFRNY
ncbi:MAG: hypothetical protein R6W90_07340, partial [Ignavibacteriaceae bacterium]